VAKYVFPVDFDFVTVRNGHQVFPGFAREQKRNAKPPLRPFGKPLDPVNNAPAIDENARDFSGPTVNLI